MKEIQILNNGDTLNAIRTKINENFELMEQGVGADPLTKFGVNEGNETNGVADLLDITDGTLNFKVGGEYPNLVTTDGNGVTTETESINPLYLENLADGEYTVVVNGSNSNITDTEFYSQLLEPENANDGDVWFNGQNSVSFTQSGYAGKVISNGEITFNCIVGTGDLLVAAGKSKSVMVSNNSGETWSLVTLNPYTEDLEIVGCEAHDNKVYLVASNRNSFYIDQNLTVWNASSVTNSSLVLHKWKKVNNIFIGFSTQGSIAYSTDLSSYATHQVSTNTIVDIIYVNGLFYAIDTSGQILSSSQLTNWASEGSVTADSKCLYAYNNNTILVGALNGMIAKLDLTTKNITTVYINKQVGNINKISKLDGDTFLIVGSGNICHITKDFVEFQQVYSTAGDLRGSYNSYAVGANGTILIVSKSGTWQPYPYIPVGEVTISGGEVTYFTTYPYNSNGLFDATSSTFGLLRTAAEPDELNCSCSDAVLTPANLYNLQNFRLGGTEYNVDDKVGCPYHHNLQLVCTQAGTTASEALNTKGTLEAGTVIEDGTVIWQVEELGTGSGRGSGFNLGDTKISDHILEGKEAEGWALMGTYVYKNAGTDRIGYPDFYTKWLAKKEAATPTEVVLADSPITMYIASNGYQFYDIADKSVIDTFYNTWGIADFYGIDEENERVFLPRNKYFIQLTDDTSKVNQMMKAGLPNVTQSFTAPAYTDVSGDKLINTTLGGSSVGSTNLGSTMKENSTWNIDFSRANEIYGNSDTVQPPSSLKLLYYCVGNTQVTESISNVTEITTSENDTLPWGYNFYSGELLEPATGYAPSLGQWNIAKDWQSFYDKVVPKIGQAFANGYIKNHTETYDEYDLVINQDDMTFRLPIFNGSEAIPNLEAQQVLAVVASGKPVNIPYNGFLRIRCTDSTYININQLPMGASNVAASTFTINEFSGLLQKGEAIPYFTGTMTNMYFIPARGNGKLYFKLANAVQDLNLLKVGEMTNGLANKVDLSNTNWAIRACIADYTAGVTKSNNVDYTAEVAGLLVTRAAGNKNCNVYINGATVGVAGGSATNVNYNNEFFVDKNDTYKCANWDKITFYPLKGAN